MTVDGMEAKVKCDVDDKEQPIKHYLALSRLSSDLDLSLYSVGMPSVFQM
jgi:hypothetical protein